MSPVPPDRQAFAPLDGVDSRHGQLYWPINSDAYKQGDINSYAAIDVDLRQIYIELA